MFYYKALELAILRPAQSLVLIVILTMMLLRIG